MRLASTIIALFTFLFVAQTAPVIEERSLHNRAIEENVLDAVLNYEAYKTKRDATPEELAKREYQVVTEVLTALSDSGIVEEVLHAVATSKTLEPIVIDTLITVLKSGLLNATTVFQALDESNLIGTTVESLISDCSFYASLLELGKKYIGDLVSLISGKVGLVVSNIKRDYSIEESYSYNVKRTVITDLSVEKRDLHDIIINILESLGASGLVPAIVQNILTDSSYIPFAVDLVKAVIQNNLLNFRSLIDALKASGLVGDLFKEFFNLSTAKTIATNAFAAFQGKCNGAYSGVATTTGAMASTTAGGYSLGGYSYDTYNTMATSWPTSSDENPLAAYTLTTAATSKIAAATSVAIVITATLPK